MSQDICLIGDVRSALRLQGAREIKFSPIAYITAQPTKYLNLPLLSDDGHPSFKIQFVLERLD